MKNRLVHRPKKPVKDYFDRDVLGDATFDIERERFRSKILLQRNIRRLNACHKKALEAAARRKGLPLKLDSNGHGRGLTPPFKHSLNSGKRIEEPSQRSPGVDYPSIHFKSFAEDSIVKVVTSTPQNTNLTCPVFRIALESMSVSASNLHGICTDVTRYDCIFSLSIFDTQARNYASTPVLEAIRKGVISKWTYAYGDDEITINLPNPFDFSTSIFQENFMVDVRRRGELSRYSMELVIELSSDVSAKWPPMKASLRSTDRWHHRKLAKRSSNLTLGALMISYPGLPSAPDPNGHYRVHYFDFDNQSLHKTRFGLRFDVQQIAEDSMSSQNSESTLRIKDPFEFNSRSSPILESPERPNQGVSYLVIPAEPDGINDKMRKIQFQKLYCPFCARKGAEFRNQKELQFHLLTLHDRNEFVLDHAKQSKPDHSISRFKMYKAKPTQNENGQVQNGRYFGWTAPKRPFDIDAYLKGDHSWLGIESKTKDGAVEPDPETSTAALRKLHGGFLPARLVRDIPERQHRKFAVVATRTIDNLPLFTSVTHRKLRLSEELSESDDDVDEVWLREKQEQQATENEDKTPEAREFDVRWNKHVMTEGGVHPRYVSDSLVRWVRKDESWFRAHENRIKELVSFMAQLMSQRRINARVATEIGFMVRPRREARPTTEGPTTQRLPPRKKTQA